MGMTFSRSRESGGADPGVTYDIAIFSEVIVAADDNVYRCSLPSKIEGRQITASVVKRKVA